MLRLIIFYIQTPDFFFIIIVTTSIWLLKRLAARSYTRRIQTILRRTGTIVVFRVIEYE